MIEQGTKVFWKTTIALSIGSLLVFANVYFTQPILPVFTKEFGISPLLSSMSISLVILSLGISLLFYGPISDSYGRRGIMIVTMAVATLATFLIVFTSSYTSLLIIRVVQGIFLAGLPSLAFAYIGEEYSAKALPLAIGIYISGNTIGGMTGRILSGFITDLLNWRWAFFILGIVSLVCLLIFVLLLRPSQHFEKKPFDLKKGFSSYKIHLKNPVLCYAYLVGGLHFLLFVGQFTYITYLLSNKPYLLSPTIIGLLFLTYLAGTFSSPLAGKVSGRISRAKCIGIGIFIMVIGFFITLIPSIWTILLGLIFICFGFFFSHSVASSWVSYFATYAKASASGLYLISYYIGGSLGPIYLDKFWHKLGWPGIVIGCMLILGLTSFFTRKMSKLEKSTLMHKEVG